MIDNTITDKSNLWQPDENWSFQAKGSATVIQNISKTGELVKKQCKKVTGVFKLICVKSDFSI